MSCALGDICLLKLVPPLGPNPRCHFPTTPVAYPASFIMSAIVTQVVSIINSELPGAIPVFSCRQGYIPVNSPKREGVLVAEVA